MGRPERQGRGAKGLRRLEPGTVRCRRSPIPAPWEDLIFTTFEERLAWLRFLYFLESP
jgi:hypothetical protein